MAEARTRAFLLDRFWILERSIDAEGADFIIQRRLTSRSLLDRDAPRLGFVQAKYFQDANTTQYIHKEYVLDQSDKARTEFFLLCHAGKEDSARSFFLSAVDIAKRFKLTPDSHSKPNRFQLPGSALMDNEYEIFDAARVLNLMEQALRNADFLNNRRFMSWVMPMADDTTGPIQEKYVEHIDGLCDIPFEFNEMRKKARRALIDIEEAGFLLHDIAKSDDPQVALGLAEKLHYSHGKAVWLPDDLIGPNFDIAVGNHTKRYDQLNKAGLLGRHAALRRFVKARILSDVVPRMPMSHDAVYVLIVRYVLDELMLTNCEPSFPDCSTLSLPTEKRFDKEEIVTSGILECDQEHVVAYEMPGRYSYRVYREGKFVDDDRPWLDKFDDVAESMTSDIVQAILEKRFDTEANNEPAIE